MVDKEELIAFARRMPLRHPEVEEMLKAWLIETEVVETSPSQSIEKLEVAIMHSVMKYRLGFLNKEEVIEELTLIGGAIASERVNVGQLHHDLSQLLYSIEDGTFERVSHRSGK